MLDFPLPFCIFVKNPNEMVQALTTLKIQARCLQCGGEIGPGRPDRKFCSDGCRNRWHNKRKYPLREQLEGMVLQTLDRNHSILDRLLRIGIRSIDLVSLSQMGFDIQYVTSYKRVGRHHVYACFDFQYEMTPSRIKKLVSLCDVMPSVSSGDL